MTTPEIVKVLEETSSTNAKVEILEENSSNTELRDYFFYCLCEMKYGVKKIPEYSENDSVCNFSSMVNLLELLAKRKVTGNKAIEAVSNMLSSLDESYAVLFKNMLQKNPRCGVSKALVNRVWNNLIPEEIKLCKAMAYSKKNMEAIHYPAISQRKCDGARCLAFCVDGEVHMYSSGNKEYMNLSGIKEDILSMLPNENFVLDGELLVVDENEHVQSRKIGNGILNKSIHNTISDSEADNVRMVVWDYIPYDDYINDNAKLKYSEVLKILQSAKNVKRVSLVEMKEVSTKEEAVEHFRLMLGRGEEGTILKNLDMKWEGKRSKNCVKFKLAMETTLKIVGYNPGEGKFANLFGSCICESEDGKVVVNVSGFSDDDRVYIWEHRDELLNTCIEVLSNGIIECDGKYSLFLPRFTGFRTNEKSEADTYETIRALSEGSNALSD